MSGPMKQRLIVAENGVLEHYPRLGTPLASPAPVVTVYGSDIGDGGATDILTAINATLDGATATLDSVDTTVSVDAAIGAHQVTLTSVANLVRGDRYRLTNESNQAETVTIDGFNATTKVAYLVDALEYAYAAAGLLSTFEGLRMTIAVSSAYIPTVIRDARVVWTYAYRSGELIHDVGYYDVVLQNADWPVTTEDLREAWPAFPDFAGQDIDWMRLVQGARTLLESSLEADRLYADMLRNPKLATQYIAAKAIETYVGNNADQMRETLAYRITQTAERRESIYKYFRNFRRSADPLETKWFA